jgi:hypothetical protein
MSRLIVITLLASLAPLPGCVTERQRDDGFGTRKVKTSGAGRGVPADLRTGVDPDEPGAPRVTAGSGAVADGRAELDSITAADPCGNRAHALAGAMLFYYAVHRKLPPTLDALQAFADTGEPLEFTCPASGKAYVYDPAGLVARGTDGRLVLYDAEPSHDGARWGVVAAPPRGLRPATASAVRLAEDAFRRYAPPPPGIPAP